VVEAIQRITGVRRFCLFYDLLRPEKMQSFFCHQPGRDAVLVISPPLKPAANRVEQPVEIT
jgi:hypothetical protein